jgi:putative flippase GtrA
VELFYRILRFAAVGIATAVLYYGLLFIAVELLQWPAVAASAGVYLVVIAFNYTLHYSWTFALSSPHTAAIKRFLLMTGCGFFINISIMYLGVVTLQLNYLLAQAIAMGVIIVWNFVLSSLWVFRV